MVYSLGEARPAIVTAAGACERLRGDAGGSASSLLFRRSRAASRSRGGRDGFKLALEKGFDHRRFPPAFIEEGQPDFFDQGALPVVVGDFIKRRQAEAVRQSQVVEPARIVKRADVGALAARTGERLAKHTGRMLAAKGFGVDACREEQQGVQAAREVLVEALAEVLQVILGEVVLNRRELVFRQRLPKGLPTRMSQPGNSASSSSQAYNSSVVLSLSRWSMISCRAEWRFCDRRWPLSGCGRTFRPAGRVSRRAGEPVPRLRAVACAVPPASGAVP
jgi:hypothetical protein